MGLMLFVSASCVRLDFLPLPQTLVLVVVSEAQAEFCEVAADVIGVTGECGV